MASTGVSLLNVEDGETIHQTSLLMHGSCTDLGDECTDFISIKSKDVFDNLSNQQTWPTHKGLWKALVLLVPGTNQLTIEHNGPDGLQSSINISLNYLPRLQLPPVHLAILVAKDSPLVIDCPPVKYGALSTAHSTLDAAVQKLRLTAYMWQAITAEDLRSKGLGRRTFRLEEEWIEDTTERKGYHYESQASMKSIPKVHIVRSERTVAELRDPSTLPPINHHNRLHGGFGFPRDNLHEHFNAALRQHGAPFNAASRPVVAGLILDTHFSASTETLTAGASLGSHLPDGISLAVLGSDTIYAWPRFLEEVSACLLDRRPIDDQSSSLTGSDITTVCSNSQATLLRHLGSAFVGTVARPEASYEDFSMTSDQWQTSFLTHSSLTPDKAFQFTLQDSLLLKLRPHFRMPGDTKPSKTFLDATISFEHMSEEDSAQSDAINVTCKDAGLAQIVLTGKTVRTITIPATAVESEVQYKYKVNDLSDFPRDQPLVIKALALNGKTALIGNVWSFLAERPFIAVPNTNIVLRKRSARASYLDNPDQPVEQAQLDRKTRWTCMLRKRRRANGPLVRATAIDLRVGATFDGAVIEYSDNSRAHCGPIYAPNAGRARRRNNNNNNNNDADQNRVVHTFGGHASERGEIAQNRHLTRVEVWKNGALDGIRMTLDDGTQWGTLHDPHPRHNNDGQTIVLEAEEGHQIVGVYGMSEANGYCCEFGILTAKDGFVPEIVYDMAEMQNVVPRAEPEA